MLPVPKRRRKAAEVVEVSALCPVCHARFAPSPGRRCAICIMRAVEDSTGIFREFPDLDDLRSVYTPPAPVEVRL